MRKLTFFLGLLVLGLLWPIASEANFLTIKVVRANGDPVYGAIVTIMPNVKGIPQGTQAIEGEEFFFGVYFAEVPSGELTIWVTEADPVLDEWGSQHLIIRNAKKFTYRLDPNEVKSNIEVIFSNPGAITLKGWVDYPQGDKSCLISGAVEIMVFKKDESFAKSTVSRKDGTYELEGLIPGIYQVFALGCAGQVVESTIMLVEGESRLDLKLKPFGPKN